MGRKLTALEERFCQEFMVDNDAAAAAGRAGSRAKCLKQAAYEIRHRPRVQDRIRQLRAELWDDAKERRRRIVEEYCRIAFANMEDYMWVTEDGAGVLDLSMLDREQAAAISEVHSEVYTEGRGDDAESVKKSRIKLIDKKGALDSLARIDGLFVDRHQQLGANGDPVDPVTTLEVKIIDGANTSG